MMRVMELHVKTLPHVSVNSGHDLTGFCLKWSQMGLAPSQNIPCHLNRWIPSDYHFGRVTGPWSRTFRNVAIDNDRVMYVFMSAFRVGCIVYQCSGCRYRWSLCRKINGCSFMSVDALCVLLPDTCKWSLVSVTVKFSWWNWSDFLKRTIEAGLCESNISMKTLVYGSSLVRHKRTCDF